MFTRDYNIIVVARTSGALVNESCDLHIFVQFLCLSVFYHLCFLWSGWVIVSHHSIKSSCQKKAETNIAGVVNGMQPCSRLDMYKGSCDKDGLKGSELNV